MRDGDSAASAVERETVSSVGVVRHCVRVETRSVIFGEIKAGSISRVIGQQLLNTASLMDVVM